MAIKLKLGKPEQKKKKFKRKIRFIEQNEIK